MIGDLMDVTPFLEIKPAPRVLFDSLPERRDQVRFRVPSPSAPGGWRDVTWAEFAADIEATARWLADGRLRPGQRAAIFAPNCVQWMTAALAIQAAGGVLVPIYGSCTADQVRHIVRHCDAQVVFVDRSLPGAVGADDAPCVQPIATADGTLGAALSADAPGISSLLDALTLDQPGLMLYTSGTSGDPKGVPLSHRNIGVNARDWLEIMAPLLHEGMTDLLWLPMSHIFGFGEASLGNALGWTTWLSDPVSVLDRLPEVRPSVFMSVPSIWEKLAGDPERIAERTGGNLRLCLSGGAGLKREIKERFEEQGVLIVEGYGLTECSPTLTLNRPDAYRFDSVGRPLPTVELRLADDGEIEARGPNVFAGYHDDPEATAAAFTDDGWFKTGDVGAFTEDGFLKIVDRKKDILVTAGGKNVPPANIERRFADDPAVAHVVVYGDGRKYLVAGVWLAEPLAEREVWARIEAVNAGLARHETIKRFAVMHEPLTVEGGLLTPTLKVRRRLVYERFREIFEGLYA